MTEEGLIAKADFIGQVAAEASEESDAIERNPTIIEVLHELARYDGLNARFGGNGHDPNAYVEALAKGLTPYLTSPLEERPELVQSMGFLSWVLREPRSAQEVAEMQLLA